MSRASTGSAGAAAAEDGAELRSWSDLYLSAAWRLWPHLPAVTAAVNDRDPVHMRDVAERVLRAADDTVAAVSHGYLATRSRALHREAARWRQLVDELLTGTSDPVTLADRAEAIGVRTGTSYGILAVSTGRPPGEDGPVAQTVTYRLERVAALTGYTPDQPAGRFTLYAAAVGARPLGRPD